MSSTTYETVKFSCAIRGYHVHRNVWQPKENETLQFDHESDNDYDFCEKNLSRSRVPSTDSGLSTARNFTVYKIFARSWSHNNCYS